MEIPSLWKRNFRDMRDFSLLKLGGQLFCWCLHMVFSTLEERDYYVRPNIITFKKKSICHIKSKIYTLQTPNVYESGWVKLSGVKW